MGKYLANELSKEPVIYLSCVGAHAVRAWYAHGTHMARMWGWHRGGGTGTGTKSTRKASHKQKNNVRKAYENQRKSTRTTQEKHRKT